MKLFQLQFQSNQPYIWLWIHIQPVKLKPGAFPDYCSLKIRSTPHIDNYQRCLYIRLACENSSGIYNEFFSKVEFTSFLNRLKLSNVFVFRSKCLYNQTPMCSTLFWSKDVLRDCVWRSYLLLILCSWISQFRL